MIRVKVFQVFPQVVIKEPIHEIVKLQRQLLTQSYALYHVTSPFNILFPCEHPLARAVRSSDTEKLEFLIEAFVYLCSRMRIEK